MTEKATISELRERLADAQRDRDSFLQSFVRILDAVGCGNLFVSDEALAAGLREAATSEKARLALRAMFPQMCEHSKVLTASEMDNLRAKLAALVEAMERIKDIMGGHDGCQGFSSPEDVWGIADKAIAAAKEPTR